MDIRKYSPRQLDELIAKAQMQKKKLQRAKIGDVRRKVEKLLRDSGYTLQELFGGGGDGGKKRSARKSPNAGIKVPPKYRHPQDAKLTWTGRGKHPHWFADLLAKGHKPEDLLIR